MVPCNSSLPIKKKKTNLQTKPGMKFSLKKKSKFNLFSWIWFVLWDNLLVTAKWNLQCRRRGWIRRQRVLLRYSTEDGFLLLKEPPHNRASQAPCPTRCGLNIPGKHMWCWCIGNRTDFNTVNLSTDPRNDMTDLERWWMKRWSLVNSKVPYETLVFSPRKD